MKRGGSANGRAKQEEKGESVPRDVWQWCVSGGFSARWPPEAAPRLDKYIVEFNIPTFFKGSWPTACKERRARARATHKSGERILRVPAAVANEPLCHRSKDNIVVLLRFTLNN